MKGLIDYLKSRNVGQRLIAILTLSIMLTFICFKLEGNWPAAAFAITSSKCKYEGLAWVAGFLSLAVIGFFACDTPQNESAHLQQDQPPEPVEEHQNKNDKDTAKFLFQICWDWLKFYQEFVLKAYLAYLAVTGGVFAFWLQFHDPQAIKLVLWLPIIIGLFFSFLSATAIFWAHDSETVMKSYSRVLLPSHEDGMPAISYICLLGFFAVSTFLIALTTIAIFFNWIPIP